MLLCRHLLMAQGVEKDKLEDFPGYLLCSQVSCLGIKGQQPKTSRARTALAMIEVPQAQPGSPVRCCGSSYCCLW